MSQFLVTDRAFYTFAVVAEPQPAITGQSRTPLSDITTVLRSTKLRRARINGKRRTQWVLLLQVSYANGKSLVAESRFVGAAKVAEAIEMGAAAAAGGGPGQPSMADELAKLSELAKQGALSAAEWDRAKTLYLGKPPDRRAEDTRLLAQLHDLHRAGALSESEFNSKKWEILSRS